MAKERQFRAPKGYGAWVEGTFYESGQLLPRGTTEYRVTTVEEVEGVARGWRTFHQVVPVGTALAEIEDEFEAMIWEMESERWSL